MICKNCGHEIERQNGTGRYLHSEQKHKDGISQCIEQNDIGDFCGCVNPEPETQSKCSSTDAPRKRVEEAKK